MIPTTTTTAEREEIDAVAARLADVSVQLARTAEEIEGLSGRLAMTMGRLAEKEAES